MGLASHPIPTYFHLYELIPSTQLKPIAFVKIPLIGYWSHKPKQVGVAFCTKTTITICRNGNMRDLLSSALLCDLSLNEILYRKWFFIQGCMCLKELDPLSLAYISALYYYQTTRKAMITKRKDVDILPALPPLKAPSLLLLLAFIPKTRWW